MEKLFDNLKIKFVTGDHLDFCNLHSHVIIINRRVIRARKGRIHGLNF